MCRWLRDNTPEDSRVMAWWDYGYQARTLPGRVVTSSSPTVVDSGRQQKTAEDSTGRCALQSRVINSSRVHILPCASRPVHLTPFADQRRRQPHHHRRRKHLEPRAHRTARQVLGPSAACFRVACPSPRASAGVNEKAATASVASWHRAGRSAGGPVAREGVGRRR